MANLAVVLDNLAEAGSVTASAELPDMEARLLISSPHILDEFWQADGDSATVTLDLLADLSFDTIAVPGLTAGSGATIRVMISTSAAGAAAGDVHDVTYDASDAEFDPAYRLLSLLLPAPVSGRYVRLVISESGATHIRAGLLVAGLREVLTYHFSAGSSLGWADPSAVTKSAGQQTLIWERDSYRVASIDLPWISNAQRWGVVERILREKGRRAPLLVVLNPAADNLPQVTIWGLMTDSTPIAWSAVPTLYQKQFQIEERL